MRRLCSVVLHMSNSTDESTADVMHDQLERVVDAYRGLLRADERRLQEAMLEYERTCWAERMKRAA